MTLILFGNIKIISICNLISGTVQDFIENIFLAISHSYRYISSEVCIGIIKYVDYFDNELSG